MSATSVGSRMGHYSAVLLLVALTFVVALTGRAHASEGRIAYVVDPPDDPRAGRFVGDKIATMWSDGTHVHALASVDPSQTVLGAPTWSYNRLWVAYAAGPSRNPSSTTPSQIRVVRWDGTRDHAIAFTPPRPGWTPKNPMAMAWSPNGRYLIVAQDRTFDIDGSGRDWLIMIDLRSGVARPFLRSGQQGYRFSSVSFSPDGRYVAVGEVAYDYAVTKSLQPVLNRLVDVSTARTVFTYPSNVYGIDIAPDGKHLSFLESTSFPSLRRADMNFHGRTTLISSFYTDTTRWRVNGQDYLSYTKWSMDGTRVAVSALQLVGTYPVTLVSSVVHVGSDGFGFSTPLVGTGSWAGAFDW